MPESDRWKPHRIGGLLQTVLNKNPATTFVVIDEVALEDWCVGGLPVDENRRRQSAS